MTVAIQIQDLKKSFDGGKEFVLNGIDLEIPKNKITMIIGFSGTGKSVLMKHILGLMTPTSGSINILGSDIKVMSSQQKAKFRQKMGVMFQYAALFDDMTALENACFPLKEHRKKLSVKERTDIAIKKLEMSGLDAKHHNKLPGELSGGMRKRVALARAIALDPEMVDDLIKSTHDKIAGATSVVISHDLHAAFRIGDFVIMLHEGKVLMKGTPDEFLRTDHPLVEKFVSKGVRKP
jgi:phospholipid/cholesterol/gamma-HCH transport system ATP-binding protein